LGFAILRGYSNAHIDAAPNYTNLDVIAGADFIARLQIKSGACPVVTIKRVLVIDLITPHYDPINRM